MLIPAVTKVENKRTRWGRMDSAWYMMRQLGGCQHIRSCGYSLHNMIRNDAARMLRHERLLLRRSVDAQRQDMMDAQAAAMERYS